MMIVARPLFREDEQGEKIVAIIECLTISSSGSIILKGTFRKSLEVADCICIDKVIVFRR